MVQNLRIPRIKMKITATDSCKEALPRESRIEGEIDTEMTNKLMSGNVVLTVTVTSPNAS